MLNIQKESECRKFGIQNSRCSGSRQSEVAPKNLLRYFNQIFRSFRQWNNATLNKISEYLNENYARISMLKNSYLRADNFEYKNVVHFFPNL